MNLKSIFTKPVDRPIEGVIKADDEASLRMELEEYVLTNEVEKRLESFLDAYNNYEGANGVWVSGFFGSGKSHLLKMLAILLENRQIDGAPALDIFLPKCGGNEILRGDLKRAVGIPSKSILFNIDQKADVISKTQVDALLAVFVKVFDEMCGYYGKQPYIAHFERELDKDGLLQDFISTFETMSGKPWDWGRSRPTRVADFVDQAYTKVTGQKQKDVLDKHRQDYRLSIEDFADQVNIFIQSQAPDFRLNFFVDEVGQYIAENIKLMTNLQTIAESLATKCRGRAWVIVTAQEDMGTVVGEIGNQQGNDFSKIQARFANRMKLTSADVAEVIQKRLLLKNDEGIRLLSELHHSQANNFKTLFDFADGSQTYRNFQDRDHFIHSYPFIPYQFALFQSAIQNLSLHSAFEGKHSSVGERSMLGVFQQVAIHIGDHEIGQLATFDLMFEGIRTALKSTIQRAIIQAEGHLENAFAVRLLKALFLIKYVKEFKPTVRNLCVLMLDRFNQDLPALRKRVEEALSLLEQQTYVQRNGDLYEYLTDEEKDVEQEIKNTEVETNEVAAELEKLVFDFVIKQRKIRYDENAQDYPYSRKLDDRLHGREYELCIHVLSPFWDGLENPGLIAAKSMGAPTELLVLLPQDDRLVRDLLMYKRTERYIRQNITVTQRDEVKRILSDKGFQNQDRYADLKVRISSLVGKSKLYLAGSELDIGGEEPQARVTKGFYELIERTYPNLRMLRGIQYTEDKIKTILQDKGGTLFGNDATAPSESEQEVLAFIQSNSRGGVRTTIKHLLERFERKPYGWYYPAILCTLANLCVRGKVEIRTDGNLLEDDDLERALRNTHNHGNVVLEPQVEFTASQVRALKEFCEDFFDAPPRATEAKALGKEVGIAIQELIHQLNPLLAQNAQYPFLNALAPVLDALNDISGKPYTWYLSELTRHQDKLLDLKEGVIDPVRKFMRGPQRTIFDHAQKFIRDQDANFAYIENAEDDGLVRDSDPNEPSPANLLKAISDPDCFKGNRMQQVKAQVEILEAKVAAQLESEVARAKEIVGALKSRLCSMAEFETLTAQQQSQISRPFNEFSTGIEGQTLIAVIRDNLRRFEESDYQRLLSQMTSWAQPKPAPLTEPAAEGTPAPSPGGTLPPTSHPEPRIAYVPIRSMKVSFDKAWLADETDVERYLDSMRKALLSEIHKGKRIQI